jgi:hypothetical protein
MPVKDGRKIARCKLDPQAVAAAAGSKNRTAWAAAIEASPQSAKLKTSESGSRKA